MWKGRKPLFLFIFAYMKTGIITLGEKNYPYAFPMVAVEKVLEQLYKGDVMEYANYLISVSQQDPKSLGVTLSKALRVICVVGMEYGAKLNKSEIPFANEEDFGMYVETIDSMVPCYADFNDAFHAFFLGGEETPKATPKKGKPKAATKNP